MPNFRPDTGGQRWDRIQVASSVALRGGAAAAFPSTLLRLPAALCGACPERGSSPPVFHKSAEQKAVPSPSQRLRQPGAWAYSPRVRRAFCPPCPQPQSPPAPVGCLRLVSRSDPPGRMSTIQNLRRSLIRNWRPVCSAVGDAVLGAEPAPFPSPLPPVFCGAGPVCSLRALLWTCWVPLFCERPAVCLGRLIFSLSFAVPQFKLVTHKSSLRLSSGHSGPVLTLGNAARSSLFRPHLLVGDAGVWGTFLLGVAFRHIICGFYLLFPSQSGCPLRFKNFPQTRQCEGFLVFGNFLY